MDKIKEYQSELGEKVPKIVLEKLYDLELRKIPEKTGQKSPDYEIMDSSGNVIAVAEIKSLVQTPCSKNYLMDFILEKRIELSKKSDYNHRSKLKRHHNRAIKQLLNNRGLPTIIIFSSFDMTDYIDMGMILQEYKELYPSSPMSDVYMIIKITQNISPSSFFEIRETIKIMYNTKSGSDFSKKFFPTHSTFQNNKILPLTFRVSA